MTDRCSSSLQYQRLLLFQFSQLFFLHCHLQVEKVAQGVHVQVGRFPCPVRFSRLVGVWSSLFMIAVVRASSRFSTIRREFLPGGQRLRQLRLRVSSNFVRSATMVGVTSSEESHLKNWPISWSMICSAFSASLFALFQVGRHDPLGDRPGRTGRRSPRCSPWDRYPAGRQCR